MNHARIIDVPLRRLRAHPMNSNVMARSLLAKLREHIERTDRYPPLIVRPVAEQAADGDGPAYQVLDGHHRWRVLEELGRATAACVVWDADDAQALTLLATLNRLQGRDDPKRRAALLEALNQHLALSVGDLARHLPEDAQQVRKLLTLRAELPRPAPPTPFEQLKVSAHFFLLPGERDELESALARLGGRREQALMRLVRMHGRTPD